MFTLFDRPESTEMSLQLSLDEAGHLYQVRKTIVEMLLDRGYLVSDEDKSMDKDTFRSRYGSSPLRGQLTMLHQKEDDPSDQIFVFWPEDGSVKIQTLRKYHEKMKDEGVFRCLLIIRENLSPVAKQTMSTLRSTYIFEDFMEKELLVNITHHKLVPKHEVLSDAAKTTLLTKYKLKETQLPRMGEQDPITRYFGLSRGQVVKVIRPSETAGRYVTYRIVL